MRTIIFKWNPAFSSYTILRFLKDLSLASERDEDGRESNWSVWDHDKVSAGDRFYMLKVGFGQTGIVARGRVTSDAYLGEDWSYNDRPRYYVDYVPDFMVNPDGFKILTSEALTDAIPDFDWFGGHSGIVLSDDAADKLEALWDEYMVSQREFFENASDDNLFIALDEAEDENGYKVEFSRNYDDELELEINSYEPYFDKKLRKCIEIFDGARMMKKFKARSKRMLVKTIRQLYPSPADLSRLCADLYDYGINYRNRAYVIESEDECNDE